MNKITIKLDGAEWVELTNMVLRDSTDMEATTTDKYMRAILLTLLKQVYVKLHNKLHSLKAKNNLTLTPAEAATLVLSLEGRYDYMSISITGQIDQKLT